ncbi:hypothetical protein LguiA_027569 [Lonicera macranthoides]
MEDEEDNLSTLNNNSSLHEVEDSIMETKLPEGEEYPNGEQRDFAPNLDDSKLETVQSPIVLKEEEIVTEENEVKMKAEPKLDNEAVVEEIPWVDKKTETEVEEAKGGGEEIAVELSNTHPVDVYSPIGAEIETVDIKPEIEPPALVEAETSKDNGEPSIVVNHDGVDDDTAVEEEILAEAKMDEEGEEEEGEEISADAKMDEEGEEGESDEEERGKGSGDEIEDLQVDGGEDEIEEDDAIVGEEETPSLDATELETETDAAESVKVGGGRRKRGRNSKGTAKVPATRKKKTIEEDVCFICFDGGELVLCDRRGCPKAYHPSCVNRDEAFFRAKGRWNCGIFLFHLYVTVLYFRVGTSAASVDFDDKGSWEYLFKDYWIELKEKLSLSSDEIAQAKNPSKGSDTSAGKQESPDGQFDVNEEGGSASENSSESLEERKPKKRKGKKLSKSLAKEQGISSETVAVGSKRISTSVNTEWASKELLEFVMHMRNGDKTVLSQFDVQAMLLEYIKRNKLRDPRRKSQIICDFRLQNLFGKARVGHFEMLKLLESHFLIKEDSQIDDMQGSVVDTDVNLLEADGNAELTKGGKEKKRKMRKKGDGRGPQSNIDDYAAIDTHNINLIYLRRKLMEDLLEDAEKFSDKVVGTFVRIRIPANNQKQDIYRLVQVVGTSKADNPYKVSKRTTDIMLEILNLDKNEVITIDSISNQEFTEDECKRLRQSIKCGLINRLTVGDILDKAMEIQAARVNDLLKTPEERRRRLEEITEIHADPKMDPSYESEDNGSEMEEDTKREVYTRPRGSAFSRRPREPISPGRGSDLSPRDSWSGNRKNSGKNWELNRNLSNKSLSIKSEDATLNFERPSDTSYQRREKEVQRENNMEPFGSYSHSAVSSEASLAPISAPAVPTAAKISETDKMWHYKDPSAKVQGPFSMVQLRKWSNTGYFPADLKIWRTGKQEDDSILLTDALAGIFPTDTTNLKPKETLLRQGSEVQDGGERMLKTQPDHNSSSRGGWATPSVEVPKVSIDPVGPDLDNSANLPSPTPKQSSAGWTGGAMQSPTPDSGQLLRSSTSSSIIPSAVSKEYNVTGSLGVLTPTSLLNSGGQSVGVSENKPPSSHYGFSAASNSEQHVPSGSINSLQASQLTVGGESHLTHSYSHPHPAPVTAANMVQSVNSHNPGFGTQGWVSNPAQNMDPNSSVHMPGQPAAYAHWGGGVPSNVQNPPPDPWRPPLQSNQLNMQPQMPPNVPWGTMPGNPNMGWGGPVPGNTNMNWGPTVQGPPPGNVNPGWVVPPPGNQGFVPGNVNPGWVAPPSNQAWVPPSGPAPGNPNPGWAPSNVGPNLQAGNTNQGWVAPSGNAGANSVQGGPVAPVNPNQGWSSPATNRSTRGSEPHQHGDRFSGRRDKNRPWNRQSSFGSGGGSGGSSRSSPRGPPKVCSYYENGNCKKGSSCDFMHN